jgi:DNA-directed RNA polymerase specialized sigma24 family protein
MKPTTEWVIDALTQYEQPLLRYAKWLLGDLDAARDVVQETFLRLTRSGFPLHRSRMRACELRERLL